METKTFFAETRLAISVSSKILGEGTARSGPHPNCWEAGNEIFRIEAGGRTVRFRDRAKKNGVTPLSRSGIGTTMDYRILF